MATDTERALSSLSANRRERPMVRASPQGWSMEIASNVIFLYFVDISIGLGEKLHFNKWASWWRCRLDCFWWRHFKGSSRASFRFSTHLHSASNERNISLMVYQIASWAPMAMLFMSMIPWLHFIIRNVLGGHPQTEICYLWSAGSLARSRLKALANVEWRRFSFRGTYWSAQRLAFYWLLICNKIKCYLALLCIVFIGFFWLWSEWMNSAEILGKTLWTCLADEHQQSLRSKSKKRRKRLRRVSWK